MSDIRQEITAAICEIFHPTPSPQNDRQHCDHGDRAADEILRIIVGKFRTHRDGLAPDDPESSWTHDWDQLQAAAMICLGIDPDAYGGLPGHHPGLAR